MSLSDKILKGHHTDYSNGKVQVILLNRGVSWTGVSGQAFHLCNQESNPGHRGERHVRQPLCHQLGMRPLH